MELSRRLETVARAVTFGHRVADVGTDHGYVPIYLIKNQICPSALAMDVNKGPLERAKEHIAREDLSGKIATRQSDGLKKLQQGEADTVIMAGMGGDLICRILSDSSHFLKDGIELVLQPQSEWFKVRHMLQDFGYGIDKEWFLKEDGKYYIIIKANKRKKNNDARKNGIDNDMDRKPASENSLSMERADEYMGAESEIKELFYEYGPCLIREKHPVLKEYLQKECKKRKKIAKAIQMETKGISSEEQKIEKKDAREGERSVINKNELSENKKKRKNRQKELLEEAAKIELLLQKMEA